MCTTNTGWPTIILPRINKDLLSLCFKQDFYGQQIFCLFSIRVKKISCKTVRNFFQCCVSSFHSNSCNKPIYIFKPTVSQPRKQKDLFRLCFKWDIFTACQLFSYIIVDKKMRQKYSKKLFNHIIFLSIPTCTTNTGWTFYNLP